MLVRDRMSAPVITIAPDRPLREASRLLLRHRLRQLPVMRGEQLAGIITHRDLRAARHLGRSVATVMTAKPFTIAPDAAIDEAARLLRTYKIGGLPVVEDKQLRGIITVADVLDAFVDWSGVGASSARLVVRGRGARALETRARRAVERGRGELRWLYRDARTRPHQLHLRVIATRMADVVAALEAAGFEVVRVVKPPRAR